MQRVAGYQAISTGKDKGTYFLPAHISLSGSGHMTPLSCVDYGGGFLHAQEGTRRESVSNSNVYHKGRMIIIQSTYSISISTFILLSVEKTEKQKFKKK